NILSAHSECSARAAVVAARGSFRPCAAGTRCPLKIEATTCHELTKPEGRPAAQLALRRTLCPVSFWRIESDKSAGLTGNADRVSIQHLDSAWLNWSSVRRRGDEGQYEG